MNNQEQNIPCPVCQTKIPFDVQALLQGKTFACPKCEASIGLQAESKNQLSERMAKMEALRNKNKGTF